LKASLINYTTMKPKDPIWNFYQIDEDSNKLTTRCKDCNATGSAKVLRMSCVTNINIIFYFIKLKKY
jgi:hypothetical protein